MSTPTAEQFNYQIATCLSRGNWQGAATAAAGYRTAWPSDAAGWIYGSMAALFADDKPRALDLANHALEIEANNVQALIQKAECHLALGDRELALRAADSAAEAAADHVPALESIGTFFSIVDDHARALKIFDRAVAAAPTDSSILSKRALIHRYLGAFDLAARDYQAALAIAPGHADALKGSAELARQSADDNLIPSMEAALVVAANSNDAVTLRFGLAKSYEDIGQYDASWQHLSAGAKLERSRIKYDAAQDSGAVQRIIAGFVAQEPPMPDTTGQSPIFIVGLPRTGTTLVDRIVGSHSLVHSSGELLSLRDAIGFAVDSSAPELSTNWLDYSQALSSLSGETIAREYLARSRARRGDRPRFTDKAPSNFYYCALIFRAFPNARIVHLTRHPMAACYAIYKTRFNGGFAFSYDLLELADFYLGYRRLMAHWHGILPGRILDVAYEDLVLAQEPSTRRLLAYLDLPFEPACLDFHLNPTAISTPSAVQVRQPLYGDSLEQWRHYAEHLQPLRERLMQGGINVEAYLDDGEQL